MEKQWNCNTVKNNIPDSDPGQQHGLVLYLNDTEVIWWIRHGIECWFTLILFSVKLTQN